jgi:histidinol-phosphate aminotransferase
MPTHPQPRPNVLAIPAYVAGKAPAVRPGLTSYKLSSNENPFAPLPGVLEAAQFAAATMNRYPDMGNAALYAALGADLDVPVADLAVATGSVALIYQLVNAFCAPGDEVVYAWRSFEAYPIVCAVAGAVGVPVPLGPGERHDLPAMARAVTERTTVVIVCTPNNPTGTTVTADELSQFLQTVPRRVLVVIDEAYVEFVRDPSSPDALAVWRDHPNVMVLRTFSKAYGLAGLRVGYAVAHPAIAAALRAVSLPFGVSHVAQAAAVASLAARSELLERVEGLVARRRDLVARLGEVGWELPEAQGNFVWFPTGERTADFAAACGELGVSVRPYGSEGLRVSIGEAEALDRVVEVAARFAVAAAPPPL